MPKYRLPETRFPAATDGLQVNCCKNPHCANFGVPPKQDHKVKAGTPRNVKVDTYTRSTNADGVLVIKCSLCPQQVYAKSNVGVVEERDRQMKYLREGQDWCPDSQCVNHFVSVDSSPKSYQSWTATAAGTPKFRCKACKRFFTVGRKSSGEVRQENPEINYLLYMCVINKMPMRGCVNVFSAYGLNPLRLYRRLDWFHKRSLDFAARHERKFLTGAALPPLQLQIDRQVFQMNWRQTSDKRNVVFESICAAEGKSNYIFPTALNYDASIDRQAAEDEAAALGDATLPHAFRRHARLWLEADYGDELRTRRRMRKQMATQSGGRQRATTAEIQARYEATEQRSDPDQSFFPDLEQEQAPGYGMQIHSEYTMLGYFQMLARLTRAAPSVTCYMDQESGIRTAYMTAFGDRVIERTADAFFVRIDKGMETSDREAMVEDKLLLLRDAKRRWPDVHKDERRRMLMAESRLEPVELGRWGDQWVKHPLPHRGEPDKQMSWLTELPGLDEGTVNQMYLDASLHCVDRFFMLLRRKLSLLERPFRTRQNEENAVWHGYSPYDPFSTVRIIDIYRTYFNYCFVTGTGETPAQRLGLTDRIYTPLDILGVGALPTIAVPMAA